MPPKQNQPGKARNKKAARVRGIEKRNGYGGELQAKDEAIQLRRIEAVLRAHKSQNTGFKVSPKMLKKLQEMEIVLGNDNYGGVLKVDEKFRQSLRALGRRLQKEASGSYNANLWSSRNARAIHRVNTGNGTKKASRAPASKMNITTAQRRIKDLQAQLKILEEHNNKHGGLIAAKEVLRNKRIAKVQELHHANVSKIKKNKETRSKELNQLTSKYGNGQFKMEPLVERKFGSLWKFEEDYKKGDAKKYPFSHKVILRKRAVELQDYLDKHKNQMDPRTFEVYDAILNSATFHLPPDEYYKNRIKKIRQLKRFDKIDKKKLRQSTWSAVEKVVDEISQNNNLSPTSRSVVKKAQMHVNKKKIKDHVRTLRTELGKRKPNAKAIYRAKENLQAYDRYFDGLTDNDGATYHGLPARPRRLMKHAVAYLGEEGNGLANYEKVGNIHDLSKKLRSKMERNDPINSAEFERYKKAHKNLQIYTPPYDHRLKEKLQTYVGGNKNKSPSVSLPIRERTPSLSMQQTSVNRQSNVNAAQGLLGMQIPFSRSDDAVGALVALRQSNRIRALQAKKANKF